MVLYSRELEETVKTRKSQNGKVDFFNKKNPSFFFLFLAKCSKMTTFLSLLLLACFGFDRKRVASDGTN